VPTSWLPTLTRYLRRSIPFAVFLVFLIALPQFFLDSFIYFPEPYSGGAEWTPNPIGFQLEDVFFDAEDGVRLHGWYARAHSEGGQLANRATLLWCHGNAGNITYRYDNLSQLVERLGVDVFIFDYRGYGRSEGKPSEEGLYNDAAAAYRYLADERKVPAERLVWFGRSLGAAVAVHTALNHPAAGLIVESPMFSVREMAVTLFRLRPLGALVPNQFRAGEEIAGVRMPVLVLHGDADDIVPLSQGRRVFEAAKDPKFFYRIPGADHNDTYLIGGQPYFERWEAFLQLCLSSG